MCKFVISWVGICKKEPEHDMCAKHKEIKCVSCGKPAVKECDETSAFVCSAPLCDDCEHTICENGCNTGKLPEGKSSHVKKNEQVYKPWYERKNNRDVLVVRSEDAKV